MAEFQTAEGAVQIKVRVMRCHQNRGAAGIDFLENAEDFFGKKKKKSVAIKL